MHKSKLRLKRSKRKLFLPVLFLGVAVLFLFLVSVHKSFLVRQTKAVVPGFGSEGTYASRVEAIPLNPVDWNSKLQSGTGKKAARAAGAEEEKVRTKRFRIQAGDTASSVLADYLSTSEIVLLSRECRDIFPLHRIKAGQEYRLLFRESELIGFEYDIDEENKLHVCLEDGEFLANKEKIDYTTRQKLIQGRIETSLFEAVDTAGGTASLAVALADIFAWDVDFIRDVRQGDTFRILVAERYRRGEFVGYGKIKAARFVNSGEEFNAFRYQTRKGRSDYFNAKGQALRKTFLKAPLHFTRISSGYTWKRKHPILDKVRPHLGIDYAAPTGTPIKSVADGRVIAKGYGNGGGNYLKIRHPNGYVSVYNHMIRYAGGIRPGKVVKQGRVIGYVGSTGVSTGPHLDYRVKRHGKYINPRKIESEPVESIPQPEMAEFRRSIRPLRAALDKKGTDLASIALD
ncbi:MAG: M23 family metallopeptidase [Desulfohalobiaceae bacterium]|nr:M23 family metallopeptidase [Desulfohalobiaceae bacterium]